MSVNAWMILWKIVLIGGMIIFGITALFVTYFGFLDIKKMFTVINEEHQNKENL